MSMVQNAQCDELIMESLNINYIDESEYPSTTDIQNKCACMQLCSQQLPSAALWPWCMHRASDVAHYARSCICTCFSLPAFLPYDAWCHTHGRFFFSPVQLIWHAAAQLCVHAGGPFPCRERLRHRVRGLQRGGLSDLFHASSVVRSQCTLCSAQSKLTVGVIPTHCMHACCTMPSFLSQGVHAHARLSQPC